MAVFRVEKNKGYTRYEQSPPAKQRTDAKSKGLALTDAFTSGKLGLYPCRTFSHINKESIDAIRTAVLELEKTGYIERSQGRDEKGKMTAITYTIYEQPQSPVLENPTTDKPTSENPMQLNKDIQKTDLSKKEEISLFPHWEKKNVSTEIYKRMTGS